MIVEIAVFCIFFYRFLDYVPVLHLQCYTNYLVSIQLLDGFKGSQSVNFPSFLGFPKISTEYGRYFFLSLADYKKVAYFY